MADEVFEGDGDCSVRFVGEHDREGILVPGIHENICPGGHDAGHQYGQYDLQKGLGPVGPIHHGRFLQGKREVVQKPAQEPDGKGNSEGGIGEHQGRGRVKNAYLPHDRVEGNEEEDRGEHVVREEHGHEEFSALEAVAGKAVGGQNGHGHRNEGGEGRHQEAVAHGPEEVVFAEKPSVGLETGRLGPVGDGSAIEFGAGFDGGDEGPVEGEEKEYDESDQEQIGKEAFQKIGSPLFHALPSWFRNIVLR
ncbi:hypothetical protein SDC9_13381 [bioreactor metagenome]|uniref:Uncharacterized protein n=1 Tax=bioreactor metagenome TaxID=1076179 RepID=A0A644TL71_9ZZZZ|nr:hypothetical protein TRIP_E190081 [uncultured Spirochaetota bacterium]